MNDRDDLRSQAVRCVACWGHLRGFRRDDDGPQARDARRALANALDDLERSLDLEPCKNAGDPESLGEAVQACLRRLKAEGRATLTNRPSVTM